MDHLEDVTIMFSDLKGYTEWCSKHEPMEVYRVLNKVLYCSFTQTNDRVFNASEHAHRHIECVHTVAVLTSEACMHALTHSSMHTDVHIDARMCRRTL
jgi:Adenylate and Guanylate cyclase catalytic domain